jgi:hypothetical protein
VSAAGPAAAVRSGAKTFALPRSIAETLIPRASIPLASIPLASIPLASIPPTLITRDELVSAAGPARRTKIWEFNTNLHCSIVGTCLSTGELRQILKKLGLAPPDSTDHELHGTAVTLASRHDNAAKLLNKALDNRHKLAISQFAKVGTEDRVRELWREAVRRGEIPGAYWATLTHPATTLAVLREAFGDVHMLSHLVGAANRADIRRLCQLEADKVQLEARLERQQRALHAAVVTRDTQIHELRQALAQRVAAEPITAASGTEESAALRQLVSERDRRLASETRRRATLEARLEAAQDTAIRERTARQQAERIAQALREELDAIEASLVASCVARPCDKPSEPPLDAPRLDGVVLLYVGGRPHQVAHLRAVAERCGTTFLHHDGGIENHPNLLPGLTSRADLVLFPVDCISHDAAHAVKLLCRQAGKRFIPLRAASVTSLLAALRRPEMTGCADATK